MATQEPPLFFFRQKPSTWAENSLITSSLQSLETSFFTLALERYPHALLVCASAIESALHAADIGSNEKDGLQELVKKAAKKSQKIDELWRGGGDEFRSTRNRIVHRGFGPRDNSIASHLYLKIAFPMLSLCYSEFHSFDIMAALIPEYSSHIGVANECYTLARESGAIDLSGCFHSFTHRIRWAFKETFSADWEIASLLRSDEIGAKYELIHEAKKELERIFAEVWEFDCPVCNAIDSTVAELKFDAEREKPIRVNRMACVECGFVVSELIPFLGDILLREEIQKATSRILREYGVE